MALSYLSLQFASTASSSSSSHSLYFLFLQPKYHSSNSFSAHKFKISCCQQTLQFDTQTHQKSNNALKKKRKPRPSFLDQIQDKWSLKTPSLREKFPWQEEASTDTNQFSKDVFPAKVSQENNFVSDTVSCTPSDVKIKSILAPWSHGNASRKKHSNSENPGEIILKKNRGISKSVVRGSSKGLSNELVLTDTNKYEAKSDEFDDVLSGLVNKDISGDEDNISIIERSVALRLPWEREGFSKDQKSMKKSNTELAEKLLPETDLKRLRNMALVMVERMKVGAAGITQSLVDAIHEKWKDEEVVKLKFEGPPSKDMRRSCEILESRTGGLVIYRSGSTVVLYRGTAYKFDCVKSFNKISQAESVDDFPKAEHEKGSAKSSRTSSPYYLNDLSEEERMDLDELNTLLDGLGPRFIDWSGREPVPIDADLLPAVVPDYKPPLRLLPFQAKQTLRDKEMTFLRRTARTQPPHFALGRNRELQGLAAAMAKLWEKSAIAKIAIKRGVLNTSNERMAEELKILTGGTLISRNKEYIVFYRGNDFMPPGLSTVLTEVENSIAIRHDAEEQARNRAAIMLIDSDVKASKRPLIAGTLAETVAATSRWGNQPNNAETEKMMRENDLERRVFLLNCLQRKLNIAKAKIGLAEKALRKLHEDRDPTDLPVDLETLSDEERFLFRKIGLSMKPYLVLGRREVFDGTIENMHLHWKYRELVKILVERKTFSQVRHVAISLEAESGGVLVTIEKTMKGHVIIVYRGKNYQRPDTFRPKNLLTKRQALARSIELQRREALKHHVLELEEKIEKLKDEIEEMEASLEKE